MPGSDHRPVIVTFLCHCGCPCTSWLHKRFAEQLVSWHGIAAEKTFFPMRGIASSHPSIYFIAVSHSDQDSTNRWVAAIRGADSWGHCRPKSGVCAVGIRCIKLLAFWVRKAYSQHIGLVRKWGFGIGLWRVGLDGKQPGVLLWIRRGR